MGKETLALVAEAEQIRSHPAVQDLVGLGQSLARDRPVDIRWLVVGAEAGEAARRIADDTGYPATALETPAGAALSGGQLGELLLPFLRPMRPAVVALLHSAHAQDYAAALALGLEAACITAVQGIAGGGGNAVYQRAVCGGRWLTEVQTDDRPVVLTVLPGFFAFKDQQNNTAAVACHRPTLPPARLRWIEIRETAPESALAQADTIVAAGRGIGSPENLDLIYRLAALFPRSAVAGSRIVCDAGWLPYARQVGVTGATVTPELYLACGISGAFQHLAGMNGARFVAAVNSDPHAAIFNAADVGVVEDLAAFLPLLIEAIEKNKR